jgi:thymidylate synthase
LRDQYVHLQKVYVENLKTLEYELESYTQREDNIEFRRERESATFKEDIISLKKRISDYEQYIKKLKDLVDRDQAEALIDELTQNEQKRRDLIDIRQEIQKLKDEVDNARHVKV